MRDIATTVAQWCAEGRRFALATVIAVTGSAPRPPGTALAVDAAGTAIGGVSGGCVEGAVYDACQRVLDGADPQVHTFGYSDADAFAVGLTCGGSVSVFVTPVDPGDPAITAAARELMAGNGVALARIVSGPGTGRALAVEADLPPVSSGPYEGTKASGAQGESGVHRGLEVEADLPPVGSGPYEGAKASGAQGESGLHRGLEVDVPAVSSGPDEGAKAPGAQEESGAGGALAVAGESRSGAARKPVDGGISAGDVDPGSRAHGSLGEAKLDAEVVGRARELLAGGRFGRFDVDGRGILVEAYPPPPRLLVFGAVDFAADVVRLAKQLGYRVVVCDARGVFATPQRFPEADEIVVQWPHRYLDGITVDAATAICVLTHDAKFDIPLLERALRSEAGYIGAMGSRRTHRDRLRRLRDSGVEESALRRLRSPIGLDLGGRSSQETALSILAEITALHHGASAGFLSETDAPIHKTPAMS
ncbi:MAG TPA: XdhC family protein [Stackebrandtia sp.]|uniref:XdhC family protein n=1 Tax=Stackebrandtia sp. TaxID=2023065 RepID=UPI002D3705FF|nr:XdhC family protein [Stackebrandtia sp.]HZE39759.1 XdhC family protein [Stackebrandtia sp.]